MKETLKNVEKQKARLEAKSKKMAEKIKNRIISN